ncbi:MAG: hypothetical protein VYC82_08790 [Verrucomicrobiota bacterium]|nr:hypothetical protein [Verrucomicrobiota bacterium]
MPPDDQNKSIFDSVDRCGPRNPEVQRLAEEKGLVDPKERSDEALEGLAGDEGLRAQELEMKQLESAHEPMLPEKSIDEQLLANLGTGKNDYGVAEDLVPQIDFNTIPLTQPKRVMSKTLSSQSAGQDSVQDNSDSKDIETPSRAPKRNKKPPSLLDSYFKGL